MDWYANEHVIPRPAAAGIILRERGGREEVLLARRNDRLMFMGGHHVFPGGRIDAQDAEGAREFVDKVESADIATRIFGMAREVFEETGLLCTQTLPDTAAVEVRAARHALLKKECTFPALLSAWGLRLDGTSFHPAGTWVTPPFSPVRFNTQYFIFYLGAGQEAEVIEDDGEIVGLDWLTPMDARLRWHAGALRLSTPVAFVLRHLAAMRAAEALPWLSRTPGHTPDVPNLFELRRGIHLIPLRTETLPPATHTNCILVGEQEIWVIDPGASDPAEQAHLKEHLDHFVALGARITKVLLTHSHPDHTAAAEMIRGQFGAKIFAHKLAAEQLNFEVDGFLDGEEVIENHAGGEWRVRCIFTPGHDPGHISFLEETTRSLFCGDMAGNPGTILIAEAYGGDMRAYMDSLARLVEEDFVFMAPGHGLPLWEDSGKEKLRETLAHRRAREARIQAAWDAGARTEDELLAGAYCDVPEANRVLAAYQLRAHLRMMGLA